MKDRLHTEGEKIWADDDGKMVAWTISHCHTVSYPACDHNYQKEPMYLSKRKCF